MGNGVVTPVVLKLSVRWQRYRLGNDTAGRGAGVASTAGLRALRKG